MNLKNRDIKTFFKNLWKPVIFWTFAMFCFAFFRYYGLDHEVGILIKKDFVDTTFLTPLTILSALGTGLGILYAFVDFIVDKYLSVTMTLGLHLLIKSILYFSVTILMVSIVFSIIYIIFNLEMELSRGWWRGDKRFWAILFYIISASFVFSFLKIAIERFGRGVFLKILIGTYKNPKEEERIFMFLDLKDSTRIAENLGHLNYSQFIQDCFFDLNKVVLEYDAEIYQYVGDEVVLSWSYKKGLLNNNCIDIFFAFQQQRLSRKKYYMDKYSIYPEFKAGLHEGTLMVAEVGFVKKELAYHGDVINTSARIQAECNTYNVSLLLSEKLLKDLNIREFTTSKSLGSVLLKGKQKEVKIHTIDQNNDKFSIKNP